MLRRGLRWLGLLPSLPPEVLMADGVTLHPWYLAKALGAAGRDRESATDPRWRGSIAGKALPPEAPSSNLSAQWEAAIERLRRRRR